MSLIKVKSRGTDNVSGRRNLAINGAMQIAQRGTITGIGASNATVYTACDRFNIYTTSSAGRLTASQEAVTDLGGFPNALKLQCTTADTSVAAGELFILGQRFEGQAGTILPLMARVFYASPLTKYWIRLFNSAETSLRKFLSISGSKLNSKNIDYYMKLMTDEDHVTGTLAFISNWNIGDIEKKFKKVSVPTLFLAGMRDGIVNYKTSVRAHKKAFNAKIKLFKSEGLLIHEVSSAKIAKEINSL